MPIRKEPGSMRIEPGFVFFSYLHGILGCNPTNNAPVAVVKPMFTCINQYSPHKSCKPHHNRI